MLRGKGGYSLTEILAVVLVLSVAAAVAIPNLVTTDPSKLDLAAEECAQAIRFARGEAIRTGAPHGFNQESAAQRLRVYRVDTSATPWTEQYDVRHPISKKLYDVDLGDHPFARAETTSDDRSFRGTCNRTSLVYFDAAGIPRCLDPQTVLVEQFDFTLRLGAHSRTVSLDRVTGRVTVQ